MSMDLEQEIAVVITQLREPLKSEEEAVGWTKSVKAGYVKVFTDLLAQVQETGGTPYFGIARSLDAYGIGQGELYERMLKIANETNAQLR